LVMNPSGKVSETITNLVDPKTFAPIMSETKKTDGSFWHREFNGARVQGQERQSPIEAVEPISARFDINCFDFFGGMYGVLLATFPLKEGYSATLPSDFQGLDRIESIRWVTFNVTRKEMVAAGPNKQVEAFVVDTELPFGHYQFWLVKKAPYVIKLIYTGPRGGKQIFDMM
jgi:hypothetical protein